MPMFTLIYEIDVDADDARAAAEQAFEMMTNPEAYPPVFDVIPWDGDSRPEYSLGQWDDKRTIVDLADEPDDPETT